MKKRERSRKNLKKFKLPKKKIINLKKRPLLRLLNLFRLRMAKRKRSCHLLPKNPNLENKYRTQTLLKNLTMKSLTATESPQTPLLYH